MANGLRNPVVITADTYTVLDGALRVQAALQRGVELIRCRLVRDIHEYADAVAASHLHGKPLTQSEMAWRAYHLTEFAKTHNTKRSGVRGARSDSPPVIRPAVAKVFGVNEQVIYRLARIYQATLSHDKGATATEMLRQLDRGETTLGTIYRELFPVPSRMLRQRDAAPRTPPEPPPQVTDVAAQRRAYSSAAATLQGVIAALESLQQPSDKLAMEELKQWRKSFSSARTAVTRIARILNDQIQNREDSNT